MGIDIIHEADEWIDEWMNQVNNHSNFEKTGEGWGADFNGNLIYEIQPDENIDERVLWYVEVAEGEVFDVDTIDPDEKDDVDYGFVLKGEYKHWKAMTLDEIGPVEAMLSEKLEVEGNMQKAMQFSEGLETLADAASQVDTDFPA